MSRLGVVTHGPGRRLTKGGGKASIKKARVKFNDSNARLRRARRLYSIIVRRWVEQARDPAVYRERAYICARRAIAAGLWKMPHERMAVFGILGHWRRSDHMGWWPWRHADERRSVALDWERGFRLWLEEREKKKA